MPNKNKMKPSQIPCPKCGIPVARSDSRWNILQCAEATKREWKKQYQARFDFLQNIIWKQDSKVRHLASIVKFQYWKLTVAIESSNSDEAAKFAKELATAGQKLLEEAGL